jgi:hypothetical protein
VKINGKDGLQSSRVENRLTAADVLIRTLMAMSISISSSIKLKVNPTMIVALAC